MGFTGSKYESTKGLRTKEISALIRADIKSAVKAGELPAGKYSVRTGGSWSARTIDVTFRVDVPTVHNIARMIWMIKNPHLSSAFAPENARHIYSDRVRSIVPRLEAIVNAYNRDDSDLMTDHFDRRFYDHVGPCSEWAREVRDYEMSIARDILSDEVAA